MLVLALDTTTRAGSIAVTRDETVLALVEGDATRTHGERLPGELEKALEIASITASDLDLLVAASGPGAFTGLRIGLATIQGLAMVFETPVVAVSALDALADAAWSEIGVEPTTPIAAWMDAQRGEVFGAFYTEPPALLSGAVVPTVGAPEVLLDLASARTHDRVTFVGDGALKHASLIRDAGGGRWHVIDRVPALTPAMSRLGRRLAARGEAGPPHAVKPLYVRRPDAELDRERSHQRGRRAGDPEPQANA